MALSTYLMVALIGLSQAQMGGVTTQFELMPDELEEARAQYLAGEYEAAKPLLDAVLAGTPAPAAKEVALVLQGKVAMALGQFDEAIATFGDPALAECPAPEYLLLYKGQAYLGAGKPAQAQGLLQYLVAQHPLFLQIDKATFLLAQAYQGMGQLDIARTIVGKLLAKKKIAINRDAVVTLDWQLAKELAVPDLATLEKAIVLEHPCAEAADGITLQLSDEELLEQGNALMACKGFAKAVPVFEALLDSPAYKSTAWLKLGTLHQVHLRDDRKKAIEYFSKVVAAGGSQSSFALYHMARAYMNLEDYDKAVELFQEYVQKYPKGKFATKAAYYIGWLPFDHKEYAKAIPGFLSFLKQHKSSKKVTYILWFLSWSYYRLGKYDKALARLDELEGYGNAIVAGKAMYWKGVIHLKKGKPEKAKKEFTKIKTKYPLTYYSVLAELRLVDMGMASSVSAYTKKTPPCLQPSLTGELKSYVDLGGLVRPYFLRSIGELHAGQVEFYQYNSDVGPYLNPKPKKLYYAAIYPLFDLNYDIHVAAMKEYPKDLYGIPKTTTCLTWELHYPEAYGPVVRVLAKLNGIPPYFAYAIMRQESRYKPKQVSYTDALGVMQVIPKTAKKIAAVLGETWSRHDFFDPEMNIRYGIAYLGILLKQFKGQFAFAAAAYNAGPAAMKQFMDANQGAPFDEMVEEIAYNEARNYTRKVMEHMLRYLFLHVPPAERKPILDKMFPKKVDYEVGEGAGF